jgi:hypothetical protein
MARPHNVTHPLLPLGLYPTQIIIIIIIMVNYKINLKTNPTYLELVKC